MEKHDIGGTFIQIVCLNAQQKKKHKITTNPNRQPTNQPANLYLLLFSLYLFLSFLLYLSFTGGFKFCSIIRKCLIIKSVPNKMCILSNLSNNRPVLPKINTNSIHLTLIIIQNFYVNRKL